MSEDMSSFMNKFSSMLKNNEFPPELSNIIKNVSNSNSNGNNPINNNSGNKNCNSNSSNKINNENSQKDMSSDSKSTNDKTNFDFNNINIDAIKSLFEQNNNSNEENGSFNFDMNTMLKMKSIIDAMNSQKDDPRANLLKSLKPYLKKSRKEKVDQCIKIFNMEKVFKTLNPTGGDKKDDV